MRHVIGGTIFGNVAGDKRQRQPRHRPAIAAVDDGRANTVPGFGQRSIRQADQVHARQTGGDIRLAAFMVEGDLRANEAAR